MRVPVPEHITWPIFRLYVMKGTDVSTIRRFWSFGEVLKANIALDIQEDADRQAADKAKAKAEAKNGP